MALLNANYLGLYAFADSGQTSAYRVTDNTDLAAAKTAFLSAAGDGDYGLLVNGDDLLEDTGNVPAIGYDNSGSWANGSANLNLLAAATSTTLDMNNTIDEVVARTTICNSETYVIGGAQSWNLTADGLIQDSVTAGEEGPVALMDIARKKQYVLVRFVLDVTNKDAVNAVTGVNYIGQGIIENVSLTGGFEDTATYSVSVRGYGKLYKYVNA